MRTVKVLMLLTVFGVRVRLAVLFLVAIWIVLLYNDVKSHVSENAVIRRGFCHGERTQRGGLFTGRKIIAEESGETICLLQDNLYLISL